jgi:N-methylhydantoinase A
VFFPGHGFVETAIVLRQQLASGATLAGPAIVEFMDSTAVVPPAWSLAVLPNGVLEVTRS